MAPKTIFLTLVLLLLTTSVGLAGETTLRGTMSCYMPPQIEFNAPAEKSLPPSEPPKAEGASGRYNISKEERTLQEEELLQTEKTQTDSTGTGTQGTVTVYTVCAK